MTEYPYEPPDREYASTITAFRDFNLASTWSVRIDPDPLGPVNRIVRLMRGGQQVRACLDRVPVGAQVRLVRDEGRLTIREVFGDLERIWAAREVGGNPIEIEAIELPGWRVEVNDQTVLAVTDAELQPPRTVPHIPWLIRAYRALKAAAVQQVRADMDAIAGRLGYHRDDECGGEW